ncbi:MAG: hypothetical protein KGK16_13410, partial [Bradyrhizobium sp.]|nr:hypothetical protein [Bradyrhizobium sp.]
DAACVTSKSEGSVRCAFALRREIDQVIAAAKSGIGPNAQCRLRRAMSAAEGKAENICSY